MAVLYLTDVSGSYENGMLFTAHWLVLATLADKKTARKCITLIIFKPKSKVSFENVLGV